MYTILINDDNTMIATQVQRIVQRSKLVDDLCFLVKPVYNGYEMKNFTVSLEYVLPVSRKYKHEILVLSDDAYKDYLKYVLPVDTELTSEAGDIEIKLTFILSDLDVNGKSIQRVRKITSTMITVVPTSAWSDVIPDDTLDALDQRIIKIDAQVKAIEEYNNTISVTKADNIKYTESENSLQLMAGGSTIGDKILLKNNGSSDEDGIPAVDFSSVANQPETDTEENNVVEF